MNEGLVLVPCIGLMVLGSSPETCIGLYRVCIVTLQLCSLLSLLLTAQAAYWLLGSGVAIALVQSGEVGIQSQATVLLQEEAERRREKKPSL